MQKIFEMSSMGKMTMFLGLHVQQDSFGILLHQSNYVEEILEKFAFKDSKIALILVAEKPLLTPDPDGEFVD